MLEFANSPKILSPSPPRNPTIFREFLPKNPQCFNPPRPQLFPKIIIDRYRGIPEIPQFLSIQNNLNLICMKKEDFDYKINLNLFFL